MFVLDFFSSLMFINNLFCCFVFVVFLSVWWGGASVYFVILENAKGCIYPLNKIECQKGTSINQPYVNLLGCDSLDNFFIANENVTMKAECFGGFLLLFLCKEMIFFLGFKGQSSSGVHLIYKF